MPYPSALKLPLASLRASSSCPVPGSMLGDGACAGLYWSSSVFPMKYWQAHFNLEKTEFANKSVFFYSPKLLRAPKFSFSHFTFLGEEVDAHKKFREALAGFVGDPCLQSLSRWAPNCPILLYPIFNLWVF